MARQKPASERPRGNGAESDSIGVLYRRPGFLLRHCHQIAVAIFVDACRDRGLTPGQYGSLMLIAERPGIDQRTLAERIGLDRSTTGAIVNRLVARRLVRRQVKPQDRRGRTLATTPAGVRLLTAAHACASAAQRRLMAPLAMREQAVLIELLSRLVNAHATVSRAPFKPAANAAIQTSGNGRAIGRMS